MVMERVCLFFLGGGGGGSRTKTEGAKHMFYPTSHISSLFRGRNIRSVKVAVPLNIMTEMNKLC